MDLGPCISLQRCNNGRLSANGSGASGDVDAVRVMLLGVTDAGRPSVGIDLGYACTQQPQGSSTRASTGVCLCLCLCLYLCLQAWDDTHAPGVCLCLCLCLCVSVSVSVCRCSCVHLCMSLSVRACVLCASCACTHAFTRTCIRVHQVRSCMQGTKWHHATHTHTHTHTKRLPSPPPLTVFAQTPLEMHRDHPARTNTRQTRGTAPQCVLQICHRV